MNKTNRLFQLKIERPRNVKNDILSGLTVALALVPEAVVACAPDDALVKDTAPMTLDEIIADMVDARDRGEDVARVHSGDPSLYGAIAEQIRRLQDLDIPYEITPGVPAFAAAAAALGGSKRPSGSSPQWICCFSIGLPVLYDWFPHGPWFPPHGPYDSTYSSSLLSPIQGLLMRTPASFKVFYGHS